MRFLPILYKEKHPVHLTPDVFLPVIREHGETMRVKNL